jgi:hypothetical protein
MLIMGSGLLQDLEAGYVPEEDEGPLGLSFFLIT